MIVDETERWKAADVKEVAAYLAAPAPATVLALVATDVKRDSALAKAVAKTGEVLAYDVPKRRLPEWVAEQFGRLGAKADADACRALVEIVGDDLDELASEVQKLATWAAGEPIALRDVERLAAGSGETAIFSLTDAWGRRDVGAVLAAAESIMDRSHRPRSGELMRIVGSLVNHVGRVRRCQRLADEGVRPREAAPRLKMHPFAAEKAFAQAANYSAEELADAVVRLAELDAAAKGGSRLPAAAARDGPRLGLRLARDDAGGLRLAAGGGVPVERPPGRRLVEPAHELAVALRRRCGVALDSRLPETPHERLRGRAPAQVLGPLACGLANPLLLLLDVRHRRENARNCGRRGW